MAVYEPIVEDLVQIVRDNGGKMTYEAWLNAAGRYLSPKLLDFMRTVLQFSLENEAGQTVHYVAIRVQPVTGA